MEIATGLVLIGPHLDELQLRELAADLLASAPKINS
jgi:hypothetical protein